MQVFEALMQSGRRVLVIDDEKAIRETLEMFLVEKGLEVYQAGTGIDGLNKFVDFSPSLVILDIRLPDISGMELLKQILAHDSDAKIIMITAFHDMETTIEAMRTGALDYIRKPIDVDELDNAITKGLREIREAEMGASNLAVEYEDMDHHTIIGDSQAIRSLFKTLGLMSRHRQTVLIEGETGSGKELIAHVIHESSITRNEPFVIVDCTTLVENLFESELFGYEKGAFTGASEIKKGRIELAQGGTIFFDEVGDLNLTLQAKLLRFLEAREFTRLGGHRTLTSNARIIAATNRRLQGLVDSGQFRQDLLFRLNVLQIQVPPLRERLGDIPDLTRFFLYRINKELGTKIKRVEENALSLLRSHPWPGNVRELKNVLTKAAMEARGSVIDLEGLSSILCVPQVMGNRLSSQKGFDEVQKQYILRTMDESYWNLSEAARRLGLSRPTLRKRLKAYGLTKK